MLASTQFQGQPCIDIALPHGDKVRIALHGAHLLSWTTADGAERLYLSSQAHIDGVSPIRGGVPICFPQFNQRMLGDTPLPKHGFARTQAWEVVTSQESEGRVSAQLALRSNPATLAIWPYEFAAALTVELLPESLQITFDVQNTGDKAWPFALALHTYLQVDDIAQTELNGLGGLTYWDGVQHLSQPEVKSTQPAYGLRFTGETDSVYEGVQAALKVNHPGGRLEISQSPSLKDVVVWNPGAEKCATLDDMPTDGFRHMLCVEAARINEPVLLLPGKSWSGWQRLQFRSA